MPLFVGPPEQLASLAGWLDDLDRAAFSHATDREGSEEFLVDLRALHKVLAVGNDVLGCLNLVDAEKYAGLIGKLQPDVAVLLAGGLGGVLEPSAEQQQAGTRLRCSLREAMPYFHWLGVRVRAKVAGDTKAGETKKCRESIERDEADRVASELAAKGAILTGKHAHVKDWAKAIQQATGKTCSTSTVGKTRCWDTHGNKRGKLSRPNATVVSLTPEIEATSSDATRQAVFDQLKDEVEEKAVAGVMGSTLPDKEKATIVQQLRAGEITAARAMDLVAVVTEQAGDFKPSPLESDLPDKPRRVHGRKR